MASIILQVIFWFSAGVLVYSYIIYPFLMSFLAKGKEGNTQYHAKEELPHLSILMSLYNEESVIINKLESILIQNYPEGKLQVYIGSDCSDDKTNALVSEFIRSKKISHFHFFPFEKRQGKPGVINTLFEKTIERIPKEKQIIIITDASVILENDVAHQLCKHFKNPSIGLVDANMRHHGVNKNGIAQSEDSYISKEVGIKRNESLVNGKMMGPFGGCYAMRAELYRPVPDTFLVDDFFLCMNVLEKGFDAINEPLAVCHEPVSQEIKEEYRRKKRISTGNFQNLATFSNLLIPKGNGIAFNFLSHKLIRWLGPLFIMLSLSTNLILCLFGNLFYCYLLVFQVILVFIIPIFDTILERFQIHIPLLRNIRYFFIMNLALLDGFFNYLKGVQSNVWQPTKRPNTTEHNSGSNS